MAIDLEKEVTVCRAPVSRGFAKGSDANVIRTGGKFGAGLIRAFSVISRGDALGHGMFIDREMLSQVAKAVNDAAELGTKSRFAHPDLSGDGIGKMTGKAFDAEVVDDQVYADLHLLKSAHDAPDGNLAKYVMDLAEESPDAFGASIAFSRDREAEVAFQAENQVEFDAIDHKGNKSKQKRFQSPDPANTKNLPHVRLKSLSAVDVVDEPAANPRGLFHRGGMFDVLERGDALLDYVFGVTNDQPEVSGLGINPERLKGFVQRFAQSRGLAFSKGTPMSEDKDKTANGGNDSQLGTGAKTDSGTDISKSQVDAGKAELGAGAAGTTGTKPASESTANTVDAAQLATDRAADITAACQLAGKPELAVGFIRDSKETTSTVLSKLQAGFIAERRPQADAGGTEPQPKKDADPNAKFAADYDAQAEVYTGMGITKEDFIKAARLQAGLDKPAPKRSAV